MRSCAREELLLQLLPRNSAVRAVADELLGAGKVGFTPPEYYSGDFSTDFSAEKTRGIYAIMPYKRPRTRLQPHNDSTLESRDRVSCVGYISDVPPGGGGFAVWPGTHQSCWNKIDHWESRRRQARWRAARRLRGGRQSRQTGESRRTSCPGSCDLAARPAARLVE